MGKLAGIVLGAIVGLLLAIAYNTAAETAALEGGHRHLRFAATLLAMGGGALAGLLVGTLVDAARTRAD